MEVTAFRPQLAFGRPRVVLACARRALRSLDEGEARSAPPGKRSGLLFKPSERGGWGADAETSGGRSPPRSLAAVFRG
jgi:hypothetical protein